MKLPPYLSGKHMALVNSRHWVTSPLGRSQELRIYCGILVLHPRRCCWSAPSETTRSRRGREAASQLPLGYLRHDSKHMIQGTTAPESFRRFLHLNQGFPTTGCGASPVGVFATIDGGTCGAQAIATITGASNPGLAGTLPHLQACRGMNLFPLNACTVGATIWSHYGGGAGTPHRAYSGWPRLKLPTYACWVHCGLQRGRDLGLTADCFTSDRHPLSRDFVCGRGSLSPTVVAPVSPQAFRTARLPFTPVALHFFNLANGTRLKCCAPGGYERWRTTWYHGYFDSRHRPSSNTAARPRLR